MSDRDADSDHVDRVRAQWRVVRPDLDTSPVGIVARIGRLASYFDQSTNAVMAEYGLNRSAWDILASLRRLGKPYQLTPSELYRELMRSSGWMTNRLNELEDAGLIARRPDPGDGRGVLVRLTPDGVRLVETIIGRHLANEERLISALPNAERDQLAGLLRRLLLTHEPKAAALSGRGRPVSNKRRR